MILLYLYKLTRVGEIFFTGFLIIVKNSKMSSTKFQKVVEWVEVSGEWVEKIEETPFFKMISLPILLYGVH
jgi:hypothetical protein